MQRRFGIVLALALAAWPLHSRAQTTDLMSRMVAFDANLRSFTATMHAHVALTTFPFLSTDISATYYHKAPDLDKLEITNGLPALAQGFSKLYAHIEPPSQWDRLYVVTAGPDNGRASTFTLVPRTQGNVSRIVVTVNDAMAAVQTVDWTFANGGTASVDQHYSQIGGYTVVTSQSGHVAEPGYTGNVTTTLTDYKMNPPLADSMFTQ